MCRSAPGSCSIQDKHFPKLFMLRDLINPSNDPNYSDESLFHKKAQINYVLIMFYVSNSEYIKLNFQLTEIQTRFLQAKGTSYLI